MKIEYIYFATPAALATPTTQATSMWGDNHNTTYPVTTMDKVLRQAVVGSRTKCRMSSECKRMLRGLVDSVLDNHTETKVQLEDMLIMCDPKPTNTSAAVMKIIGDRGKQTNNNLMRLCCLLENVSQHITADFITDTVVINALDDMCCRDVSQSEVTQPETDRGEGQPTKESHGNKK